MYGNNLPSLCGLPVPEGEMALKSQHCPDWLRGHGRVHLQGSETEGKPFEPLPGSSTQSLSQGSGGHYWRRPAYAEPSPLGHVRALPSCRKRDLEEAAEPNSQENSWLVSVEAEASPQRLCSVFLGLPVTHCVAVHHSSVHSRPHTCVGASVSSALYTVNELHHITKL